MEVYAGIDLHSRDSYIGVIDEKDKQLLGKRLPNNLSQISVALRPFKETLRAVVVEKSMGVRPTHFTPLNIHANFVNFGTNHNQT